MTRRIMIACPTSAGSPDYTTALSINRATQEAHARGWIVDTVFRIKDSMITRARNVMFSMFVQSECTDLFFWDDDVACAPGSFLQLMDHPVDIVGGSYRSRRGDKEEYVLKTMADGLVEIGKEQPGLIEVEASPTGFLRITRNCALKMVEAYGDLWFYDSTSPAGLKIYCFFDFNLVVEKRQYWSEDYYFCKRWRDIGGKVWIDPFLTLTHTGKEAWTGNLFEYLKANCAVVGADVPALPAPVIQDETTSVIEAAKAMLNEPEAAA